MRWTSELTPSELKRIKEVGGEPKPLAPRWQKQPLAELSPLRQVPRAFWQSRLPGNCLDPSLDRLLLTASALESLEVPHTGSI